MNHKTDMNHKIGFAKYNMKEYWDKRAVIGEDVYKKVCMYNASFVFNEIMDKVQKKCLLDLLKKSRKPLNKMKVLEVGCGVGRWAKFMKSLGVDYVGVDISNKMIEAAKKNVSGVNFKVIDGESLSDFSSDYFDLVFTITVLHHIPYDRKNNLIKEIVRVTKKEGNILIIEDIIHKTNKQNNFNMFPYSVRGWVDIFKHFGCTPIKINKHKFLYKKLHKISKISFLNNTIFAIFWANVIEEMAIKIMPWDFFSAAGILLEKE